MFEFFLYFYEEFFYFIKSFFFEEINIVFIIEFFKIILKEVFFGYLLLWFDI